jgi:hypothetical protein
MEAREARWPCWNVREMETADVVETDLSGMTVEAVTIEAITMAVVKTHDLFTGTLIRLNHVTVAVQVHLL